MLQRVFREQTEGQGLTEYGLIMLLVSIAAITILGLLGVAVLEFLETVPDAFAKIGS